MNVELYRRRFDGWLEEMGPLELAKSVSNTDFVRRSMRGNPAAICAAVLYGDAVGLAPMVALQWIDVIDGMPALRAEAKRALVLVAGHELWVEESSTVRCTVAGRRRGQEQTTRVVWTIDDARRANLAGKKNWREYPRAMLLARASSELARQVFPDVTGGLATVEELLDDGAVDGELVEPVAELEPARTRARRRPSSRVAAEPEPAVEPVVDEPEDDPELEPEPVEPEPVDEPEPEPETPRYIAESDRRFLHGRKHELGLSDDELKDEIEHLTGQRSTTRIPAELFGELLNAMARRQLERAPEAPAGPGPGQEQLDDVGREPHEDPG